MTEPGHDDADGLRARLQEIDAQLLAMSLPPAMEFGAPIGQRDELEEEAAEIRERLGVEDPRPTLSRGCSRTGWIIIGLTAIVIVALLAWSSFW
ncbi:hypothetical protein [Microbacterium sp. P02]|uniref:hypothetical protein n=1 Tax=Microbacterium sp. P02 TaxID=3366260 RepID=UPI0036710370